MLAARQRGVICHVFWSMMVQGGVSVGGEVRVQDVGKVMRL